MKKLLKMLFVKEVKEEVPAWDPQKNSSEATRDSYNRIHGLGDTLI
ncbi:hypothetical protein [Streptococcus vestibularis]|nr:hypothetical protein [Streptococcus vestibularis]MCB8556832.1 hypothetical protein [Streptococcus vestibularis]MCB8587622.1 hypothetical protein [Streptococcus vestibularis]